MKSMKEVKIPAAPSAPPRISGIQTRPRAALTPRRPAVPRHRRRVPAAVGRVWSSTRSWTQSWVRSWNPDLIRQGVVTLAAAAYLIGPGITAEAASPPGETLLSPAGGTYSVWLLVDAGLAAYALHQWLPSQRRRQRQRRLGWTVSSALVLLIALRLTGEQGPSTLAASVAALLLLILLATLRPLNRYPARSRLEGAAVDVPLGLLLGWVIIETATITAAAATDRGADLFTLGAQTWALIAVAAVTMGAAVICMTGRGHVALAVVVSWGLGGILLARLFGDPQSGPVAYAAGLAVFLLLISSGSRRHRVDHHRRRRLRAIQDAARPPLDLLGGSVDQG